MRENTIEQILKEKVIAIVRGVGSEQCLRVAEALYQGGIRLVEITFNQNNPDSFSETTDAIAAIGKTYAGKMLCGAGTVTSVELVDRAADAGAKYIISPDSNPAVIRRTLERGMVSIPGAMTPTEILAAHNAGADFVKLFPAAALGTDYIKAVRAPINHVRLLAVGGINEKNIGAFLAAGLYGAGVGGNLANKAWIQAGEYERITTAAEELVANARA
jgi:2-dehydro-3-deoxyphosphogluconate aldolase/(4S)-4-hydroxy-2-oxoglutarate aldolase